MGNLPAKIEQEAGIPGEFRGKGRKKSQSVSVVNGHYSYDLSCESPRSTRPRKNSTLSMVGPPKFRGRANSASFGIKQKKKSTKEKEKVKEAHAMQLVVKYDETVDGGFLAPFGSYNLDKLDYDDYAVKEAIIKRKLAPFYTPLEDYNESWTDEELVKIVNGLPLHASFISNSDEFDDIPLGNSERDKLKDMIDPSLSKNEQRKIRYKRFKAKLHTKRILWQDNENEKYLEKKIADNSKSLKSPDKNMFLSSHDLKLVLYRNGLECPICFLYFPQPLNYSICCSQPICTECFVQIRRADPHFPHDENDPTKLNTTDEDKDPSLLTSEPISCPYCATPNFAVSYKPSLDIRTGIAGIQPALFNLIKMKNGFYAEQNRRKVSSLIVNETSTITSDDIRPGWRHKLDKERKRLAKRAANANAIHVRNQLVNSEYLNRSETQLDSDVKSSSVAPTTIMMGNNGSNSGSNDLESKMIEEAIKKSIEDESERQKKVNQENTSDTIKKDKIIEEKIKDEQSKSDQENVEEDSEVSDDLDKKSTKQSEYEQSLQEEQLGDVQPEFNEENDKVEEGDEHHPDSEMKDLAIDDENSDTLEEIRDPEIENGNTDDYMKRQHEIEEEMKARQLQIERIKAEQLKFEQLRAEQQLKAKQLNNNEFQVNQSSLSKSDDPHSNTISALRSEFITN